MAGNYHLLSRVYRLLRKEASEINLKDVFLVKKCHQAFQQQGIALWTKPFSTVKNKNRPLFKKRHEKELLETEIPNLEINGNYMRLQEVTTFRFHDLVGSSNDLSLVLYPRSTCPTHVLFPLQFVLSFWSCHFRRTFLPTGLWRAIIFMAPMWGQISPGHCHQTWLQ